MSESVAQVCKEGLEDAANRWNTLHPSVKAIASEKVLDFIDDVQSQDGRQDVVVRMNGIAAKLVAQMALAGLSTLTAVDSHYGPKEAPTRKRKGK